MRALGGRIAIVTNRLQSECADTEAVFKTHTLVYDVMLCRPDGARRTRILVLKRSPPVAHRRARRHWRWLAFLGDNISTFPRLSQASKAQGDKELSKFGGRYLPRTQPDVWQLAVMSGALAFRALAGPRPRAAD